MTTWSARSRPTSLASCVGPVTAAAFEMWGVPTIFPDRSRLVAMVKQLETELPSRTAGTTLEVAGHRLLVHGETVLLDGVETKLSPAPFAVLQSLMVNPGHVVARRDLLGALPSGTAGLRARGRDGGRPAARLDRHPVRADRGQARLPAGGEPVLRLVPSRTAPAPSSGNRVAREL